MNEKSMKEGFKRLSKRNLNNINELILLLIIGTLPFTIRLNSLFIIIYVTINLFNLRKPTKIEIIKFLPYLLLFLVFVMSYFLSNNKRDALFFLEKKLAILIFSCVFLFSKQEINYRRCLLCFVYTVLLAVAITTAGSIWNYVVHDERWFTYQKLAQTLNLHPTYFSLYINFAISILLFSKANSKKELLLNGLITTLITAFNLFLLSRIGIAIMILLYFTFVIKLLFIAKKVRAAVIIMIVLVSLGWLASLNSSIRYRIKSTFPTSYTDKYKWEGINVRLKEWESALEIISDYPLLGVSIGDYQDVLLRYYEKNNFLHGLSNKYNVHNQFLDTQIKLGVLGTICYVACFFLFFKFGVRDKNLNSVLFLFIVLLTSMTETILSRQKGLVFYALFSMIFLKSFDSKANQKNK